MQTEADEARDVVRVFLGVGVLIAIVLRPGR